MAADRVPIPNERNRFTLNYFVLFIPDNKRSVVSLG